MLKDDGEPFAVVELKHGAMREWEPNWQTDIQRKIADALNVPYFVVFYFLPGLNYVSEPPRPNPWDKPAYMVISLNEIARKQGVSEEAPLSEHEYVSLLWRMAGKGVPPATFEKGLPTGIWCRLPKIKE